ncbi:adhesion G-protein coupled receptor G7 [Protopterus annectens]|uniref:adhesion G-protein coupled receptor G7 n=1 Tax=Protopterus annectens TaxID=7888 RepID=UPI001CF9DD56|nr:adhesion G-protein coupled receptor G7 [Protopterus annectens]
MPEKQSWKKRCFQITCCIVTALLLTVWVWLIITAYTKAAGSIPLPHPTTPSTTTPPAIQCQNNGTFRDGICICLDEWKGDYCEIANFCEESFSCEMTDCRTNVTFDRILIGRYGYSKEQCQDSSTNMERPKATRLCSEINGMPTFGKPVFVSCNESLDTLKTEVENVTSDLELRRIAEKMQVLTAQPQQLDSNNIATAANITGQIFLKTEEFNTTETSEAAAVAIITVSQLLDANDTSFDDNGSTYDAVVKLTQSLEVFSLHNSTNDTQVVQPNLAVQSLSINQGRNHGILFTSLRGLNETLVSSRVRVNNNASDMEANPNADIQIFLNVSTEEGVPGRIGFLLYQNAKFFSSKKYEQTKSFSRRIVSGSITNGRLNKVELLFRAEDLPPFTFLNDYSCVSWNYSEKEWSTLGCTKDGNETHFLLCSCSHTTNFAVLMNFKYNYRYADPLDIISKIGCGLSIVGLFFTILFHVSTRKTRKTSVTWIWVNLCLSMLIVNIIFLCGITNENKQEGSRANSTKNQILVSDVTHPTSEDNPLCTVVAALLHYFLLSTFIWTAVFAVQMYFRLRTTLGQLPKHFMWFAYGFGWGLPAVVMPITFAATFEKDNITTYRQEEFCWLAALGVQGKFQFSKPLFAAFLLPVGIILVVNIVIFLILTVQIFWKDNAHLRSTRKKSNMKKFMSTLSVAVLFGITWSLGYLTLIEHDVIRIVFSFVFCIINATQGLQIFILFVVRSSSFKEKMTPVIDYLSSVRIYLHSKTIFLDRVINTNTQESYRQLDSFSSSAWLSSSETN